MKKLNRRDALRAGGLFTLGTFANFEKLWSNSVNDEPKQQQIYFSKP